MELRRRRRVLPDRVYAQIYGFGAAGFAKATAPLPQLADVVGLGELGHFIAIGITCSMFACALACLTAGSRMLLSLGHDGLAPKVLTHTSQHTKAPDFAIWAVAIPMTVIPVAYIAAGSTDTVLSTEMGTLATYGFMLAYALVCLAAPFFLFRRGESLAPGGDPRRPGRGHDGVRLLRQLDPAADPERHLPRPDLAASGSCRTSSSSGPRSAWPGTSSIRRNRPEVIASAGRWGDDCGVSAGTWEAASCGMISKRGRAAAAAAASRRPAIFEPGRPGSSRTISSPAADRIRPNVSPTRSP